MKYIITYIMYLWSPVPCHEYKGGNVACAALHMQREEIRKEEIVTGWDNAVNFADSLKRKSNEGFWLNSPSYDSVIVKPYNRLTIESTGIGFRVIGTPTTSARADVQK